MNFLIYCLKSILKIIIICFHAITSNGRILSFIHPKTKVGEGVVIKRNVGISKYVKEIGRYTFIHSDTTLDFVSSIGSFCSISRNVKIGLGAHPQKKISTSPVFYNPDRGVVKITSYDTIKEKGFTVIEHDVLISANVCILEGIHIGVGAIIGAGAVVTKDVPPYAIVAGVPAKIIGYRFEQGIQEYLLKEKWWNLPIKEILVKSKKWRV